MTFVRRAVLAGSLVLAGCSAQLSSSSLDPNAGGPSPRAECADCNLGQSGASDAAEPPKTPTTPETCTPGDVTQYRLQWSAKPAELHQGVCSDSEIASIYGQCVAQGATAKGCADFVKAMGSTSCAACLLPMPGSTATTAFALEGDTYVPNVAGCLASFQDLVECGHAYKQKAECGQLACEANCRQSTKEEYSRCVSAAYKRQCKAYADAVAKCTASLTAEPQRCIGSGDEAHFESIAKLICGQ